MIPVLASEIVTEVSPDGTVCTSHTCYILFHTDIRNKLHDICTRLTSMGTVWIFRKKLLRQYRKVFLSVRGLRSTSFCERNAKNERTNADAETTAKAQRFYEEALAAIKSRDEFYKQTQEELEDMADIPQETQKAISERNHAINDLYRKAASYVRRFIMFVILCHSCYRFHPCNRSQVGPLRGATKTVKM